MAGHQKKGLEMEFKVNLYSSYIKQKVLRIQFYWLLVAFTSRGIKSNTIQEEFIF